MSQRQQRILIVDDNPTNCLICQEMLQDDYSLLVVESGEAALEAAAEFDPDLILLDVMMPGIDGIEVCRQLRRSTRPWVKIIMVSAKVQVEDRVAGYDAGADDYLPKPFDEQELMAKIRVHLRMKHIEEINDVKCRLLQVLQHGNRTPMTKVLSGASELYTKYDILSDEQRLAQIATIESGANDLQSWMGAGEQLIKLMTGQVKLSAHAINVQQRVTEIIEKIEAKDPANRDRISVCLNGEIEAKMDPEYFDLLLERLLCDSLANTDMQTPVIIGIDKWDFERLRISVNRGNVSLNPELMPLIFEPFGEPTAILEGASDGMSLAIVREIARVQGGLVRAQNLKSRGLKIVVELPLVQQPTATDDSDQRKQAAC